MSDKREMGIEELQLDSKNARSHGRQNREAESTGLYEATEGVDVNWVGEDKPADVSPPEMSPCEQFCSNDAWQDCDCELKQAFESGNTKVWPV